MPVSPLGSVDGCQDRLGPHVADVDKSVLKNALLGSHLGAKLDMLQGTAAADAKRWAGRGHARCGLAAHLNQTTRGPGTSISGNREPDPLTGDGTGDEHGLAIESGHTTTLAIERLDASFENFSNTDRYAAGTPSSATHVAGPDTAGAAAPSQASM